MARIDPKLLGALQNKLGLRRAQVYERIKRIGNARMLDRRLAAMALAAEAGLALSRFATPEDLAHLRAGVQPMSVAPAQKPLLHRNKTPKSRDRSKSGNQRRGNTVFVVHGRNERIRRSLFGFLRAVGLNPLEWQKAVALTKKGSPYVGEILDTAFNKAVAIVVLLTPDDEACLKQEFLKPSDPPYEKDFSAQPRPNVLFEAGMAFGKNSDSTVLVQVGQIRPFSDIGGRHVVHLSNDLESRQELLTKLSNAGCNVDMMGADWHHEGDFSI